MDYRMSTHDASLLSTQEPTPAITTIERLKLMAEDVRLRGELTHYFNSVSAYFSPPAFREVIRRLNDAGETIAEISNEQLVNSKDRMAWYFLEYIADNSDEENSNFDDIRNGQVTDDLVEIDEFLTKLIGAAPEHSAERLAFLQNFTLEADCQYDQLGSRPDPREGLTRALEVVTADKSFSAESIDTFVSSFSSLQKTIRSVAEDGYPLFDVEKYEDSDQSDDDFERPEKTTHEKLTYLNRKINTGIDDRALTLFADTAATLAVVSDEAEHQLRIAKQELESMRNAHKRVDADSRPLQRPRLDGPQLDEVAAPHGPQLDDRNRDIDVRGN